MLSSELSFKSTAQLFFSVMKSTDNDNNIQQTNVNILIYC